jgi:hypothetical protein
MDDQGYPDGMMILEVSERTGAARHKMVMGGEVRVMYGGSEDDPYWDVPPRAVDVDKCIYEQISREMIHDHWDKGEPLEAFIQSIRTEAAKAPKGCSVFVKYDKESDYEGGYYYFLQVGYERPPTKAEKAQRRKINQLVSERDSKLTEEAAEQERHTFERLKAKFEQQ